LKFSVQQRHRYARTSTIEQVAGLEAQIRDLKAAGAEKLFRENVSSVAPRHVQPRLGRFTERHRLQDRR